MRHEMIQPNGAYVTIDLCGESSSSYTEEDFKKDPTLRGLIQGSVYVHGPWGSNIYPRETWRRFYWDDKGLYTYKTQKVPFYYWEPQNIEEDYDNWTKDKKGYHIPLNEPRKLKKVIFY